ncbi:MAG: TolC family protein, partial [Magnetococcales bacterium]|nr:TolC family protein [Magnetococcales bacterium]
MTRPAFWLTFLAFTCANPGLLSANLFDAEEMNTPVMTLQSGEETLTLDTTLAIALRDNLGLISKEVQLQGKEASATASFRKMLPTVAVSSSRTDILRNTTLYGSKAETFNTSLTLTQPIYRGGALVSGWQSADAQREQAQLDLVHTARTLIKDVKAAWYSLLEKNQLLKEAEAAMDRLHQHEKNAQAFFREGRIWRNEILQAGVKVAQGEQNLIG